MMLDAKIDSVKVYEQMYACGQSISSLSKAWGFSETTLYGMLHGKTKPQIKTLVRLAEALDCKIEDLTTQKNREMPETSPKEENK